MPAKNAAKKTAKKPAKKAAANPSRKSARKKPPKKSAKPEKAQQPTHNHAPLQWGRSREMNAVEAMMWRGESDPRLRSPILSLAILDCAPEWERFFAACEWATRMAPRFRQKVVEPSFGMGTPRWVTDPNFDLHYHVRRLALAKGASWREAFAMVEQIAMTPFDRARAPWEAILIEGLPNKQAGLVVKLHHSVTDGMGGTQLFTQLYSRTREHNPNKPQPAAPSPEWVQPRELLRDQLGRDTRSATGGVLAGAEGLLKSLSNPAKAAKDVRELAESAARVLGDNGVEGSPLLRERSLSWRFLALDVEFKDLKAAGKAGGGTLNDAFLAALLGGFRLYHAHFAQPIEEMPMAMPISVRNEDDPEGGNKFTGARFAVPVGIVDPGQRMQAIHKIVRGARGEPALDAMGLVAPVLSRLPGSVLGALSGSMTASNDLQASNVPGFREDLFVAGARIDRVYGFGPLPGCASMITMVSHGDTCCIAVNVDRAAITDPDLFGQCLEDGFAEVLALAEGTGGAVRLV